MKKFITMFLGMALVFSAVILPTSVRADGYSVSTTNTASLEAQLNAKQQALIPVLNQMVVLLKAQYMNVLEQKLLSAQLQLVPLLQTQLSILKAQLGAKA